MNDLVKFYNFRLIHIQKLFTFIRSNAASFQSSELDFIP